MSLAGVAARNVLNNRLRTVLTMTAIGLSMFAFLLIQTVLGAWSTGTTQSVRHRIVGYDNVNSLLPVTYIDVIRKNAHIRAATYSVYFDGVDPAHSSSFFGSAAVDPESYLQVFPDAVVPPDQAKAWVEDARGALVGSLLATTMGWKIGDRVTLESPTFPSVEPWTFTIRAIFTTTTKSLQQKYFVFHFKYLNEGLTEPEKNRFRWYTALVDDGRNIPAAVQEIDGYFSDKEFETESMDEETFRTSIFAGGAAVQKALQAVSVLLLGLTMLVLGNTISMGVRERTKQYGVLRALGFRPRHVALLIIFESAFIGLGGGVILGALGAYAVVRGVLKKVVQEELPMLFPDFSLAPSMMLLAIGLALAAGALASVIPARRISRMPLVDALRQIG